MRYAHILTLLGLLLLRPVSSAQAARIIAIDVDSVVHPITVEILNHAIEQARREKADLLLIRLTHLAV